MLTFIVRLGSKQSSLQRHSELVICKLFFKHFGVTTKPKLFLANKALSLFDFKGQFYFMFFKKI